MRKTALLENLTFHDNTPYSEPLLVDANARILRFMLKPGQSIAEHNAPSSPFYVVILHGRGIFTDGLGARHLVEPHDLLVFDIAENHSVQAGDEPFVFLGILQHAPSVRPDHVGGSLASDE